MQQRHTNFQGCVNEGHRDGVRRLLLGIVVVLTLLYGVILLYHVLSTVIFPYDLDYGEGYELNDAVLLAHGTSIYRGLGDFPMVRSPYPPLFPLLWSIVVPLFGPLFWPGRALSALALFGICGLVAWNAVRVDFGRWPVIVSLGLLVGSPFVYQWAAYARVDLLALSLAAAGVVTAQWVPTRRGVLIAAVLCTLAILTKQTAITAAVAVGLALVMRDRRSGILFGTLVVSASLGIYLAINAQTDGQFLQHVLVASTGKPFSFLRAASFVLTFIVLHLALVLVALGWAASTLKKEPAPVAMYVPLALLASVSAGNVGSSVNYLVEPLIACTLALPFAWRALPKGTLLLPPFLAAAQLAMLFHWPNGVGTDYLATAPHGHTPTAQDYAVGREIDTVVRSYPGEVLAEPAGFAVRNERPVYIQPFDLRVEQALGRWQSDKLSMALTSGRFGLIVSGYGLLPSDMKSVLRQRFSQLSSIPSDDGLTFYLYHYKDP